MIAVHYNNGWKYKQQDHACHEGEHDDCPKSGSNNEENRMDTTAGRRLPCLDFYGMGSILSSDESGP
ncbi:hypothetical protein D3C75_1001030 [compost metagenome]